MFAIVPILFFLSGLTALLYQMVWMRELILVFGASMFAISTLLTAFMGGLALGSWFFGKRAARFKNPLWTYALLELGIGVYAFLVPLFFSALLPVYQVLSNWFDFSFYAFSLVRFVLALVILLLPTALMGGTLPVLAQRYKNRASVGKGVGLLYAFNTLGAVAGVLAAGFVLLPSLGLQKTTLLAATLNGVIAILAFLLGKNEPPQAQNEAVVIEKVKRKKVGQEESDDERRMIRILLAVFAISGFSAMIYEVVWTRILTLLLGSTVYSYATMLSTYLLGLALGSFLFSLLLKRFSRPLLLLALVQAGIAFFGFVGEFIFPILPTMFSEFMGVFHTWAKVRAASKFLLSASVMILPTLLMGGIFPLVIHILSARKNAERQSLGETVGRAYAVNTVGTILGSFTVGFILLPGFGIQKSLHFAIVINTLMALVLWFSAIKQEPAKKGGSSNKRIFATAGGLAFLSLMTFSSPAWDPLSMSSDLFGQRSKLKLLYYKEGISATVTVVQHQTLAKDAHLSLAIDGKVNASTTGDMETQLLVAHLPMLLADKTDTVLLIGHGSGITTGSMTLYPIKRLVTTELEPAVIEASRFFDPYSHDVLDDPRVELVEDDARNFLLRTDEQFDVIVSEPSHPWRSGSAKLFTKEFFEIGKAHLTDGGIFSQWIHFYGIRAAELKTVIKTFHSVFPEVLIFYTDAGDLIMLGAKSPYQIDRAEITRRIAIPEVAKDLSRAEIFSITDLWAHFLLGPNEITRYVGDAELNTDDFTLVEFQTPKSLFEDTMSIHIAEMKGAAASGGNYLFGPNDSDEIKAAAYVDIAEALMRDDKLEEAQKMIETGLALKDLAKAHWMMGRIYFRAGNRRSAEQAWLKALELDATHEPTLLKLTDLYQSQGAFKKASVYLDKIDNTKAYAGYYKGVDFYFRGKYGPALIYFKRGALFSEPFGYFYEYLVFSKLGMELDVKPALGKYINSLEVWRKELEREPEKFRNLPYWKNVQWRRKVGVSIPEEERMALLFERIVAQPLSALYGGAGLYLSGRYRDALTVLEKAKTDLGPQNKGSLINYYLGLSYKALGRPAEAKSAFQGFLDGHTLDEDDIRVIEAKKEARQMVSSLP